MVFLCAAGCAAQAPAAPSAPGIEDNAHPRILPANCPAHADFEKSGYTVASSRLENPFDFLPWVHPRDALAAAEIAKLVDHQPFRYSTAVSGALNILGERDDLPEAPGALVRISAALVTVRCSGNTVDLVYRLYASQVGPALTGTPEGQAQVVRTPQTAAGMASTPVTASGAVLQLEPAFAFDSTDKLTSGGRLALNLCEACGIPVEFVAEGQGSQAMNSVHAAVTARRDTPGFLMHSIYRLNYNSVSDPAGSGAIHQSQASLQYAATTRAFLNGNVNARLGALLGKGDAQAHLPPSVALSASLASPVNALKLYGGLDSRLPHNVLAVSFGLELASADVADGIQWKKYLGDVHHDFFHNLGDHHSFDLDSRLTLGAVTGGSAAPVAERFFGGGTEQLFMPGDDWQIREDPVIRAIPGSRLYLTPDGPGANRFTALNLTAALAVWRRPLVPPEVSRNPKFLTLLNGQMNSATSIEQLHYATLDIHYANIVKELPVILASLRTLSTALGAAQQSHPGQFAPQFRACSGALKMAAARAQSAAASGDSQQYGRVAALLTADPDEDRLTKVVTACDRDLNASLGPGSALDLTALEQEQQTIEAQFRLIDQKGAAARAASEMKFVRRTIDTLFNEVNLISVSPVAVFDAAGIGPSAAGLGGIRYGPGGGLRLEIASSVNFTAGYARNLDPGPGEGNGAFFFALGVRDLFH